MREKKVESLTKLEGLTRRRLCYHHSARRGFAITILSEHIGVRGACIGIQKFLDGHLLHPALHCEERLSRIDFNYVEGTLLVDIGIVY